MISEELSALFPLERLPLIGVIWHYTSIDVLEHFLRGEIAFSHYKFLNDDLELAYGRQLLRDIFDRLKDEELRKFMEGQIVDEFVADSYLFCLSREGDNLYQWRAYTLNGGIAVGFDRCKLYSALHSGLSAQEWSSAVEKISGIFFRCHYNDTFVERVVGKLKRSLDSHHGMSCDECKRLELLCKMSMKVVLSQKNPSFREEHEERFLLMGVPKNKMEIINGKPRILVNNPSISKAISHVCMSPNGDRERNKLLVEFMRDKYGLDFKIMQSNSSFNGR